MLFLPEPDLWWYAINKTIVSLKELIISSIKKGLINVEIRFSYPSLKVIVPHGWILPVMPGSKYVSVGGTLLISFLENSKKNQLKYYLKEIKLVLEMEN